jgi:hypothetical protein
MLLSNEIANRFSFPGAVFEESTLMDPELQGVARIASCEKTRRAGKPSSDKNAADCVHITRQT